MNLIRWLVTALIALSMLMAPFNSDTHHARAGSLPPLRRVNAPGFGAQGVQGSLMAIFWFGRVTPSENYTDVRVGYNDQELVVNLTVFDRNVWTEDTPSALTQWDGATLYLDTDGNTGGSLDSHSLRFDGEVTNGSSGRSAWQAFYRGSGTQWLPANLNFTTESGWNVTAPNDNTEDDRGWIMEFHVPFASLGLSGPPPQGALWGMAIASHDRDSAAGPPNPDKVWPDAMNVTQPATWGQLRFGQPTYQPPAAIAHAPLIIRNGLNGAVVPDGDVGGHTDCGANYYPHYFNGWGDANYAGELYVNVQNQAQLGDWPCFSKYYVTFPLNAVPSGKVIISATLTLYQFGNTGGGPWGPPATAHTQILSVDSEWNENTLTWNTAPEARENIAIATLDPLPDTQPPPTVPRIWDVSGAAAEAYAANQPLRLAAYAADLPSQTGRYFRSSEFDDAYRPTLTIIWGDAGSTINAAVSPSTASIGQTITYTLSVLGSGRALTLTDDLSGAVSAPGTITSNQSAAIYNPMSHRVAWTGMLSIGQWLTITYPVTVLVSAPTAISNLAVLTDSLGLFSSATTVVIANGLRVWLPLVMK